MRSISFFCLECAAQACRLQSSGDYNITPSARSPILVWRARHGLVRRWPLETLMSHRTSVVVVFPARASASQANKIPKPATDRFLLPTRALHGPVRCRSPMCLRYFSTAVYSTVYKAVLINIRTSVRPRAAADRGPSRWDWSPAHPRESAHPTSQRVQPNSGASCRPLPGSSSAGP